MSNPQKLQEKLHELLKEQPNYNIFPQYPWGEEDFDEVLALVRNFVELNIDLVEGDDPLRDWIDSYYFWKESQGG